MKVFALRRPSAAEPASYLRHRITRTVRRAAERLAAVNARVDEGRMLRDRANEANAGVDRSFWIYLR